MQESIEGVTDLARERARIDSEKLSGVLFAKILQDSQSGALTDEQLINILRKRQQGEDMVALYEEFVVKPKAAQMQPGISGAGPAGLMPGMPMGMPPGGGPGGPGGPGAPTGPMPPMPPDPSQLMAMLGGGNPNAPMPAQTGGGR